MPPEDQAIRALEAAAKRINANPMRFLEETLAATRTLRQFTTQFQRQERLGLFAELKAAEDIFAEYRDEPFSVRFTWLNEDSEYWQCVYVEGKHGNKVVLLPRTGLFGLPPSVRTFSPALGVVFRKTRNPITDFGPRRLMERTLDRIEKAKPHGDVTVKLLAQAEIGPAKEPCFHLVIRYPEEDRYACKLQDLYIHTQTRLPVATYLWLPGSPERTEDTLDAVYVYGRLDTNVMLGDGHFVIDADKPRSERTTETADKHQEGSPTASPATAQSGQEPDQ